MYQPLLDLVPVLGLQHSDVRLDQARSSQSHESVSNGTFTPSSEHKRPSGGR